MENIIKKLQIISEKGNIKDFEFLYQHIDYKEQAVKSLAIHILYDIKNPKLVKLIGEKLKENIPLQKRIALISVCWQSSLDFSEYFDIFIKDAIEDNILMTIESMSAIENILDNKKINKSIIEEAIRVIKKSYPNLSGDIQLLINELLNILNKVY